MDKTKPNKKSKTMAQISVTWKKFNESLLSAVITLLARRKRKKQSEEPGKLENLSRDPFLSQIFT